jgi:hypothetical protein
MKSGGAGMDEVCMTTELLPESNEEEMKGEGCGEVWGGGGIENDRDSFFGVQWCCDGRKCVKHRIHAHSFKSFLACIHFGIYSQLQLDFRMN